MNYEAKCINIKGQPVGVQLAKGEEQLRAAYMIMFLTVKIHLNLLLYQ